MAKNANLTNNISWLRYIPFDFFGVWLPIKSHAVIG
jgi:hypothetical protein